MKRATGRFTAAVFAFASIIPVSAYATNGYFLIGYGAKSRAMGGVGVALSLDSLSAASNPAAMAFAGTRLDVGADLFAPPRQVAVQNGLFVLTANDVKSGSNLFLIPNMGMNIMVSDRLAVGMSVIGNGSNTRYRPNFFDILIKNQPPTVGVNLMQVQMLPTVAYKVTPTQSVGVSMAVGIQTFRAYGLGDFTIPQFQFTSNGSRLTNQGNDWSYGVGARVGWQGHFFNDRVSVGLNYASKVYMSKLTKYSGLFAQQGSFDIPSHFAIGIAVKPIPKLTVALDVQRILYGQIPAIANRQPTTSIQDDTCTRPIGQPVKSCPSGRTAPPEPTSHALGASSGWGFGWRNQTVYKLGMAYEYNDRLTLRAGFNYGKSPIPDDQLLFNLLAPGIVEKHLTLGLTYGLSPASELSFNYMHAFKKSQVCAAPGCKTMFTQGAGQFVAAKMSEDALGAEFAYKF